MLLQVTTAGLWIRNDLFRIRLRIRILFRIRQSWFPPRESCAVTIPMFSKLKLFREIFFGKKRFLFILIVYLVEKFQILSEKFCFKFITDPKWFIPDPTLDPTGSGYGSTTLNDSVQSSSLSIRSRGKELWTQLAAPPVHPAAKHLLHHLPPPLCLQVQEGPAGLPEGK